MEPSVTNRNVSDDSCNPLPLKVNQNLELPTSSSSNVYSYNSPKNPTGMTAFHPTGN